MDRLSPLDSSFLHVEDGITHMHVASCAIFERPAPPYEDVVALVASKLPLMPRVPPEGALRTRPARPAGVGR